MPRDRYNGTMKIDPVHFFDDKGHSWASRDWLAAEVDRLKGENETLRRRMAALVKKHQASEPVETISTIN